MLSGNLTVGEEEYIGGNYGTGAFNQSGRTHTVKSNLWLGYYVGGKGTYSQSGGTLDVGGNLNLGAHSGRATYNLSGGTLHVSGNIAFDESSGASTFILDGGWLSVDGDMTFHDLHVGYDNVVTFTHPQGKDIHVRGDLHLGTNAGSSGTYILKGYRALSVSGSIIDGDGTGRLILDGGTLNVGGNITVDELSLGHTLEYTPRTVSYTQTEGKNITVNNDLILGTDGYVGGSHTYVSGVYTLQGGVLHVGGNIVGSKYGSLYVDGGQLSVTDGSIALKYFELARSSGTDVSYTLSDGQSLSVKYEYIGRWGTAVLNQNGGTNSITNLYLGWESGSQGTYRLSGGTLEVSGKIASGTGTLILDGGTFSVGGNIDVTTLYVGDNNSFSFTQAGQNVTVDGTLHLGNRSGSSGNYTLTDGTLDVKGDVTDGSGTGILTQEGGQLKVSGNIHLEELRLGYHGIGSYTQTAGTNDLTTLRVGKYAGAEGTYNLTGGRLNTGLVEIGPSGTGTLNNSGGEHYMTNNLYIGTYGSGVGTYELGGTGYLSAPKEFLGNEGTATFNQRGGGNTVTNTLYLGFWSSGHGTYNLGGGTLSVPQLIVGRYGSGTFSQTGGTNTVTGDLYLGKEPGSSGTYTISGGSLEVKDFYIGNNGSGTLNIIDPAAEVTVSGLLNFGADSTFTAVPGTTIHMTGSAFENYNTDSADLSGLDNLELIFEGGAAEVDRFEIGGRDLGAVMEGFDDNFALGTLTLGGADIGQVQLVDTFDNQPDWDGDEALYVYNLIIGPDSYLDLNGLNLYYLNGTIDAEATVIYNGGHLTPAYRTGRRLAWGGRILHRCECHHYGQQI